MREILQQVETWLSAGRKVTIATVVKVYKSAPRPAGAVMAVNDRGEVFGSVSGGCVESALFDEASEILASDRPKLITYGISDDQAFEVGLTCGGTIEVFAERLDAAPHLMSELAGALRAEQPVLVATVINSGAIGSKLLIRAESVTGSTGLPGLDAALVAEGRDMLLKGTTGLRRFGSSGEQGGEDLTVFMESFAPTPRMIVFGAIDFAVATVRIGKFLGYRVTLCDARSTFATPARFPDADEVVVQWPHEYLAGTVVGPRDAIAVLTHDSKFDIPALIEALKTPAAYIAVLGSRKTHERRQQELLEAGVSPNDLARLSSPVGLDIGGNTPEEMAVSLAAELIALRNGRSGGRLSHSAGRIHSPQT